jgi:phosphatidyl-myo-inositol dimannoside synthase
MSHRSAESPLRILILSPGFPPTRGGIERTAGEIARGLDDFQVQVVAGAPPRDEGPGLEPPVGVPVRWARNDPPYGRRATLALLREAVAAGVRFRPDVVCALHVRTTPAARTLQRICGSRTVVVVHAKEVREQPRLSRAALRWADAVVAVSAFSRQLALESGAAPERVRIIHPGVTIQPSPPEPVAHRPGPPTIITVARMADRHKGHDTALVAMTLLRKRMPDARWLMIGDGPLRQELGEAARSLGLDDCVKFTGPVDDGALVRHLSDSHAFCLLSRQPSQNAAGEGFGIVFIEAGARGLPVVACRVPGVIDAVREGITGLLVEPGDPHQAAAALERVLTDQTLSASLGEAGFAHATELAWPAVIDRYRRLLREVVAAPSRSQRSRDLYWLADLARGPIPSD